MCCFFFIVVDQPSSFFFINNVSRFFSSAPVSSTAFFNAFLIEFQVVAAATKLQCWKLEQPVDQTLDYLCLSTPIYCGINNPNKETQRIGSETITSFSFWGENREKKEVGLVEEVISGT